MKLPIAVKLDSPEKKRLFKKFEKAVITYPFSDSEELNDEHEFIFEWFWKETEDIREKAWIYDDLNNS